MKKEEINRKGMIEAMKNVLPAVDKKEFSTGEDSFVFDEDWIRGYNGFLSVSYPFSTGIKAVVRADELFRILNKMRGDSIFLSSEEGSIQIKSGTTSLKMNVIEDAADIRRSLGSLKINKIKWEDIPKDFMDGVRLCSYSMGVNPTMPFLMGLRVEGDEILSSDDLRVSLFKTEGSVKKGFSLPRDSVVSLLKLGIEPIGIFSGRSWVHFKTENGAIYSSRVLKERFPDDRVRELLPEDPKELGKEYTFPDGLEECIDRAGIFCQEDEDSDIAYISLYVEGKGLVVHGSTPIGEVYDVVPYDEIPMIEKKVLKVAPEFLKRVLRITRKFRMTETSIFFQTNNFQHLVSAYIAS